MSPRATVELPPLSCLSPNPIEMNSAAKLNEFGNQVTNLQQKIDLIVAKAASGTGTGGQPPSLRTPPPIEETGDVERDFETVFQFNNNSTDKIELRVKSPPPPPLPITAPPPPVSPRPVVIQKQVSINSLNTLKPWQKQHEYRPMSVVLKDKQEDHPPPPPPLANISFNFKPIGAVASASEEDIREKGSHGKSVLSPTPIYSSVSVQNLLDGRESGQKEEEEATIHGSLDNLFKSKSSDDLVMPDIDGIQGIRSNKYKKIRHDLRSSASHEEIAKEPKQQQEEEEDFYENLDKIREEVKHLKMEAADLDRKKAEMEVFIRPVVKKPKPLPRVNSETELNRSSKTLSFVFDAKANEFVLEPERVHLMPNVDMIERNSQLLQQRSSSASNIVPIHVSSPRKSTPGMNGKSLDSLDIARDPEPTNTLNEKGNFFNFRFFGRGHKDEKPAKEVGQRQSVFYGEPVDLISMDEHKYEAKLVHIADDEEGEEEEEDRGSVMDQNHYEVVTVNETFNRTMATFSQHQQQQSVVSRGGGGSRKFEYVMQVIGSLLNYSASVRHCECVSLGLLEWFLYCEWFFVVLSFVDAFIYVLLVDRIPAIY